MSHKSIFVSWLSIVLLGAGTSGEGELSGILGESVTFRVKTSPPFQLIIWSKIASGKAEIIALVTFGESCGLQIHSGAYEKRVTVSKDCRALHLNHLKKEDAGRFTAGIVLPYVAKVDESFELQIFRRLLPTEIRVTCTPEGYGSGTWRLNCFAGVWEDRVNLSWTSAGRSTHPTPGSSVVILRDLDLNFTCRAENLVSKVSRIVSSKLVCAGQTKDFCWRPLWALLGLSKMGSLLLLGCLGLVLLVKSRKGSPRGDNWVSWKLKTEKNQLEEMDPEMEGETQSRYSEVTGNPQPSEETKRDKEGLENPMDSCRDPEIPVGGEGSGPSL